MTCLEVLLIWGWGQGGLVSNPRTINLHSPRYSVADCLKPICNSILRNSTPVKLIKLGGHIPNGFNPVF